MYLLSYYSITYAWNLSSRRQFCAHFDFPFASLLSFTKSWIKKEELVNNNSSPMIGSVLHSNLLHSLNVSNFFIFFFLDEEWKGVSFDRHCWLHSKVTNNTGMHVSIHTS